MFKFLEPNKKEIDFVKRLNESFNKYNSKKTPAGKRFYDIKLVYDAIKYGGHRMVSYLVSTIHKWMGSQTFYIIRIFDEDEKFGIKIGITHNNVDKRNLEYRYMNGYTSEEVLGLYYYDSGLAVSMLEDFVTKKFKGRNIELKIDAPGKGEIFPESMEDEIIGAVENEYRKYKDYIGLRRK
jgi:hypothetical protein